MRGLLLLAATLVTGASIAAGTAFGGTYEVPACTGPAPAINDAWQPFNNSATYLEASSSCGASPITGGSSATSGLAASDVLPLSTNVPAGALAGWLFAAPAGDSISAISVNRDLYDQSEGWNPQIVDAAGNPLPGETCPFNAGNGGCEVSGMSTQRGLNTTSLAIELLCNPEPVGLTACANGFFEHDARVELNSATVTITDQDPPEINSPGGSLFAAGLVRGALSGTVEGSDTSGVQYARLYVDGNLFTQRANGCDFHETVPCPTTSASQFSLDTNALSSGPHEIQAGVIDAAGNQSLTQPVRITVENASPGAPTGLLVNGKAGGAWVNQPATITWTNPAQTTDDPISRANWIACPGGDASAPVSGCETEQHQTVSTSSLTFGPLQYRAFADRPQGLYTVFVWLQDAIGNSARGNAAAISFGYETSPPPPPRSIAAAGHGPFTITLGAPADAAPLIASHWIACNSAGVCTSTQLAPGLSFKFAPALTPPFRSRPYGRYTVRAWLQDAAGNSSPANSVAVTITRRRPEPGPRLHILEIVRAGDILRVRGSVARLVAGNLLVVARYTLGASSRSVETTVRVRNGVWAASIKLPHRARTDRVTAVRHSSVHWSAQTVTRYVRRGG
jgi:hypothetical protein